MQDLAHHPRSIENSPRAERDHERRNRVGFAFALIAVACVLASIQLPAGQIEINDDATRMDIQTARTANAHAHLFAAEYQINPAPSTE